MSTAKFHNKTNTNRVVKIIETLNLIAKSGDANKAKREDYVTLLQPLFDALKPFTEQLVSLAAEPLTDAPVASESPARVLKSVMEVEQALDGLDLNELSAVAIKLSACLDAEIYKLRSKIGEE